MTIHEHSSISDHGYQASYFVPDLDATGLGVTSIDIVVTSPASGSFWLGEDVASAGVCKVVVTEGVTIDTPGTAMVFYGRSQQGDHPDVCDCLIERTGAYSGGEVILTTIEVAFGETGHHFLMEQDTTYLITVTSREDDNYASVVVRVWEA